MSKISPFELKLHSSQGIDYFSSEGLSKEYSIDIAFTLREGGVSKTPFNTLNLATHVGDDPADVLVNRKRLAEALSISQEKMVFCEQVHGSNVSTLTSDCKGLRSDMGVRIFLDSDGLMTKDKDEAILVLVADCVPLIIVEPTARVTSVVHAGWRGTFDRIVDKALSLMVSDFGVDEKNILAFFGPSICGIDYEVSKELFDKFADKFSLSGDNMLPQNQLDLESINKRELISLGVPKENIFSTGISTARDKRCFSYRRDGGRTGRMAALSVIR